MTMSELAHLSGPKPYILSEFVISLATSETFPPKTVVAKLFSDRSLLLLFRPESGFSNVKKSLFANVFLMLIPYQVCRLRLCWKEVHKLCFDTILKCQRQADFWGVKFQARSFSKPIDTYCILWIVIEVYYNFLVCAQTYFRPGKACWKYWRDLPCLNFLTDLLFVRVYRRKLAITFLTPVQITKPEIFYLEFKVTKVSTGFLPQHYEIEGKEENCP